MELFSWFPLPSICNAKAGDAQPTLCADIPLPYLCTLMACIKISSPRKSGFARDKLPSHLLVKFCASAVLKLKQVAWKGAGGVALCAACGCQAGGSTALGEELPCFGVGALVMGPRQLHVEPL